MHILEVMILFFTFFMDQITSFLRFEKDRQNIDIYMVLSRYLLFWDRRKTPIVPTFSPCSYCDWRRGRCDLFLGLSDQAGSSSGGGGGKKRRRGGLHTLFKRG